MNGKICHTRLLRVALSINRHLKKHLRPKLQYFEEKICLFIYFLSKYCYNKCLVCISPNYEILNSFAIKKTSIKFDVIYGRSLHYLSPVTLQRIRLKIKVSWVRISFHPTLDGNGVKRHRQSMLHNKKGVKIPSQFWALFD